MPFLFLMGCGPALYVSDVLDAEHGLEEARAANARFHHWSDRPELHLDA